MTEFLVLSRSIRCAFLCLLLVSSIHSLSAQTSPMPATKIKVYLVGTFHFNSSPTDVIRGTKVDMNTPDNQRELDELVGKLQQTQADKVFVEWTLDRQRAVDSTYALYRNDRFTLGNNEVYQVGYRLAKQLNLSRVYCVDADGEFDFPATQEYAKAHGQEAILDGRFGDEPSDSTGTLIAARIEAIKDTQAPDTTYAGNSLLAQFMRMNAESSYEGAMESYVIGLARVGNGDEYPGADLAGEFYKRNVRIYTNMLRQVDVQQDKAIVIIIGQGHIAFLKSILMYNPLFEVQDVMPLLTAK